MKFNKTILTLIASLLLSFSLNAQNLYQIDSLRWQKYLDAAFKGSHDLNTNKNTKISSKNGACKISFMNIQARMNDQRIDPNDVKTQKTALDMSQMENGFYESTSRSKYILIDPILNDDVLTLKRYITSNNRKDINVGITTHIKTELLKDSITNGYFAFAFGVAAGYHLFHLLIDVRSSEIDWYLFDDFGINGQMIENLKPEEYSKSSMTENEVSDYLLKYLHHAAYIYQKSKNLRNPVTIEGKTWSGGDRPLWTKFYQIID